MTPREPIEALRAYSIGDVIPVQEARDLAASRMLAALIGLQGNRPAGSCDCSDCMEPWAAASVALEQAWRAGIKP